MKRGLESLYRRIILATGRGILKSVNDKAKRQFTQITALNGEVKNNVERIQNYGVTSHPPKQSQVLFVCMGGNRDHPVVLAAEDLASRPKDLKEGEVCIYTDEGDKITLSRGRKIDIETATLTINASSKVRVETPEFEVTGEITDRVDTDGISMQDMRAIYDSHTHTGDDGGTTSAPHQLMED